MQDSRYGGNNNNYIWGSDGDSSSLAKLDQAGFDVGAIAKTADCGIPNPCTTGFISAALAKALYEGAKSGATTAQVAAHDATSRMLQTYRMSETSVATTHELFGKMKDVYGAEYDVPCGSGFKNDTHFISGAWKDHELCDTDLIGAQEETACKALWAHNKWEKPELPRCPETLVSETAEWGKCSAHQMSCPPSMAYYGQSNPKFMDW